MHVLVVDSDRDTRDLVYHVLSHAGYEVSQAHGAADALRMSGQYPDIGVVLTDIRLVHRIGGMDMPGNMRQSLHNCHYILASGDWNALESHRSHDVSVLRKPYGKADLLRAVRNGAKHLQAGRVSRLSAATLQREPCMLLA